MFGIFKNKTKKENTYRQWIIYHPTLDCGDNCIRWWVFDPDAKRINPMFLRLSVRQGTYHLELSGKHSDFNEKLGIMGEDFSIPSVAGFSDTPTIGRLFAKLFEQLKHRNVDLYMRPGTLENVVKILKSKSMRKPYGLPKDSGWMLERKDETKDPDHVKDTLKRLRIPNKAYLLDISSAEDLEWKNPPEGESRGIKLMDGSEVWIPAQPLPLATKWEVWREVVYLDIIRPLRRFIRC